jgi:hypothetical protein
MNIGIIGSRRRNTENDLQKITNTFHNLQSEHKDIIIISGGATKGGDRFAEIIACLQKIPIKIFYADWDKYGKIAGFQRNTDIAKNSDILIACVHPDRTGGTEDTIKKFKKFYPNGRVILV